MLAPERGMAYFTLQPKIQQVELQLPSGIGICTFENAFLHIIAQIYEHSLQPLQ
jgi:hypothetical protein